MIDGAKQQWALEKKKEATDTPTEFDLITYIPDGRMPSCPAGGVYVIKAIGEEPTCSIPTHALPQYKQRTNSGR
jgi:hypothetical protein